MSLLHKWTHLFIMEHVTMLRINQHYCFYMFFFSFSPLNLFYITFVLHFVACYITSDMIYLDFFPFFISQKPCIINGWGRGVSRLLYRDWVGCRLFISIVYTSKIQKNKKKLFVQKHIVMEVMCSQVYNLCLWNVYMANTACFAYFCI